MYLHIHSTSGSILAQTNYLEAFGALPRCLCFLNPSIMGCEQFSGAGAITIGHLFLGGAGTFPEHIAQTGIVCVFALTVAAVGLWAMSHIRTNTPVIHHKVLVLPSGGVVRVAYG